MDLDYTEVEENLQRIFDLKQNLLTENDFKYVNGESVLGSGFINITGGDISLPIAYFEVNDDGELIVDIPDGMANIFSIEDGCLMANVDDGIVPYYIEDRTIYYRLYGKDANILRLISALVGE